MKSPANSTKQGEVNGAGHPVERAAAAHPRRDAASPPRCPVAPLFQALGGKWALPTLYELHTADRPLRFGELRSAVGAITTSELTKTLRLLSEIGLVERVQYGEIPPRVEYACTPLGRSLRPHLDGLAGWLRQNEALLLKSLASGEQTGSVDQEAAET